MDLKDAAKREARHYWMGTKLLAAEVRTARHLLVLTLQGTSLTRRERKQLLRTVTDVFRLVPMSIFVLIPFMEFALPFALKLFPNMLPSTFRDSLREEENMKRELKSRIAMTEFFQETLRDLARERKRRAESMKVRNDAAVVSSSSALATPTPTPTPPAPPSAEEDGSVPSASAASALCFCCSIFFLLPSALLFLSLARSLNVS